MKRVYKIILIVVCIFMLFLTEAYAQDCSWWDKVVIPENKQEAVKVKKDGLWGLVDFDGNVIVSPYWDYIGDYNDGLYLVKKGSIYGYIDEKGSIIIEPCFGHAVNFSEGLTSFKKDDLYGFIDKNLNIVIQPVWKEVYEFNNGIAKVVSTSGKMGYIDNKGKVVVDAVWDNIGDFSEGLCPVSKNGKMGYIDNNGNVVIDLIYKWVGGFSNGVSKAILDDKYGLIDKNNNIISKFQWDYLGEFRDDMVVASIIDNSELFGYISLDGKTIINPVWNNTVAFNEGFAPVMKDGRWGYIDKTGKIVIPCNYKYVGLFYNSVSVVKNDSGYIFINKSGNIINNNTWDNYGSYVNGKIIPVCKDGKWGFMNIDGVMLTENKYDDITTYCNGYIGVKLNNKWGYVNANGELVIEPKWDSVSSFYNGIAYVKLDNKYAIINEKGEYLFISEELKIMEKLGLMQGDGNGVTATYANKTSTRIQSAVMVLRINGLEQQALNYNGQNNFKDGKNYSWQQGANLMSYLKDNPEIGFIGDNKNCFLPNVELTQKQYVKVMLENLGYKQNEDFKYDDTLSFAKSIGINIEDTSNFTNYDLAKTTVMFLNAKTTDGIKFIEKLINLGVVSKNVAKELGFI